jgi:hypothetical protein
VDAVGRMGVVGGADESDEGGSGSGESESGALTLTVEVARDTRAENGWMKYLRCREAARGVSAAVKAEP